ncbi:PA14 domain-containing protein [Streptomyces sp. NL15-2K]|uniref:PA14 domain-containing protein n=1 Tax=Streptomyces sp. NL15-2K TaxID=376149 RepID=UPI000F56E78A|nr:MULTISPECIES: PA14 domain-containing protein [Actinomycetes]WKX11195.1 PA14 domain-containing protein [Kutzneria buriramensis]GCB47392.1 hypothetical protein SNL152K_4696 [Streptomyces sp. NL15-2K]
MRSLALRATAPAVVLATAGGLLTALAAPASAATTCTSPVFKRQFFANTTFSGTPKKTDCDNAIDQNWGTGAPASGLPTNNFGVRWSVTRDFGSGGPFALSASGLDGIRVYLDGVRKIDLWKNLSTTVSKTVNVTIPSGKHTLRVDYVNWTGSANVKFAYTPRTSATVDTVKPLTPTGTSVSYDTTTGRAKLIWAKNKEMDLAGYRVYRRLKGTSYGSTPLATTTSTSYTDATLPVAGDAYYYEVRAYDKAGNVSTGTADQLVTTVDRVAPGVPAGVEITDASEAGGLRVGWSAVPGAASYRVYRAASADGTYTRLTDTAQLSYKDTSATVRTTYYYRVSALDAAGNESARSATASGTRQDDTPPPTVTGLTVTPTKYGFVLDWDANPAPDLFRYVVYTGELLRDGEDSVCSAHQEAWLAPGVTSYRYTTLPDGVERCFLIDVYDTSWNSPYEWSKSGEIVSATELDITPSVPTPEDSPVRLTAIPNQGNVDLSWYPVTDATGYQVYRWNPDTKAYEKLAATTTATSYVDTAAATGTTHFYWVTALYADGTESAAGGDWAVMPPE